MPSHSGGVGFYSIQPLSPVHMAFGDLGPMAYRFVDLLEATGLTLWQGPATWAYLLWLLSLPISLCICRQSITDQP
jgi:hypothetical protein